MNEKKREKIGRMNFGRMNLGTMSDEG